jgi:hydrogenase maturation protease
VSNPRRLPLVIGYGNPLRADDGFGWQVAQRLAASLPDDAATVLAVHQLTPELAEAIGRASLAVFVDAHAGGQPGKLMVQTLTANSRGPASFSHDVDAVAILTLAHVVSGRCPPAVMLSVGGGDFGYGVGLSAAVEATVPEVMARVAAMVRTGCLDTTALQQERT